MLALKSSTARYAKLLSTSHSSQITKPSVAPRSAPLSVSPHASCELISQQTRSFHLSSVMAAVPKKKQSYSRVRIRTHSQNWQIRMQDWTHRQPCSHCGKQILRHNVCNHCGWYKGIPIFLRAVKRQELKNVKAALKAQHSETTTDASASP